MGPEKLLLVAAERPDQVGAIDPPTAQRLAGGLVFTDQLTARIKADQVPVEELVHMGGKQQAVSTAQPLAVVAIAPSSASTTRCTRTAASAWSSISFSSNSPRVLLSPAR